MPASAFLDTNVLLDAYDPSDRRRQLIARDLAVVELGRRGGKKTIFRNGAGKRKAAARKATAKRWGKKKGS